ncbi:hypothetical protein CYQ92_24205 [Escherichia coli]|nr:hypothetical protein CYQ92_24205 [Escherichia coli]
MIGLDMMMACAPNVAPATIEKVIQVESGGNPLALNVNVKWVIERDEKGNPIMVTAADGQTKPKRRKVVFKSPIAIKTAQDAVTVAYMAIDAGHSVDMGYMQVNSTNLKSLGYTVEDMFIDRNLNPQKTKKAPQNGCFFNTPCAPYERKRLLNRMTLIDTGYECRFLLRFR